MLPVAAPAWPYLQKLTLKMMGFTEFPEGLAGALVSLTYLDLSFNSFARLPAAVGLLSNLQHFELSRNEPLQLEEEDVATLVALPHLHTLNIKKSCGCMDARSMNWNEMSVDALFAIKKRFPLLKSPFLTENI